MATKKLLVVLLLGASAVSAAAQSKEERPTDPLARQRALAPRQRIQAHLLETGEAAGYRVIDAGRVELPEIGDFADHGLALRGDGGDVQKVLLLGSTGEAVSWLDVERLRRERERDRLGKLSHALSDRLSQEAAGTPLRLSIWTAPAPPEENRPAFFATTEEAAAYRRRVRAERSRHLAAGRAAMLRTLERLGGVDTQALVSPPVLETTLPASAVAALAAEPDVAAVDLAATEDVYRELHQATFFYDADDHESMETYADTGRLGTGINAGVYELSGLCGLWRENATTPDGFSSLSGYTQMTTAAVHGCDQPGVSDGDACNTGCNNGPGFCRGGRCMKEHVTMVASKLGSVRGTEERNAAEMNLFYANDQSQSARLNWLVGNGVTIVNDSEAGGDWPAINSAVRNDFVTVTRSTGNSWAQPVGCPENTICVGSYSIVNTGNIDWWKTDPDNSAGRYALSGSTSFIDYATHWDAEKPDVMGDGEASLISQMVTPRAGGWGSSSGTSFAAPMVGGIVALLQEDFPTAQNWPELVRPMMLTSAISHNVTGASLSRNAGPDELDGAGVPTASTLQKIVDDGTYRTLSLSSTDFDASGRYVPLGAQVTLAPGETVRAVLGWMYCVESNSTVLSADFDLELVDQSTGTPVDWSRSFTNSLEMVQFTNDSGGSRTYDLVIVKDAQVTCDGVDNEYAGLAWTKTADDLGPSRFFPVSKAGDTGDENCDADCSLREAIQDANAFPGFDRIELPANTYNLQIAGTLENAAATGDLDITDDLEIVGAGAADTVISGALLDRVFHVLNGAQVRLAGLTITFGSIGFEGGGIAISSGDLTLEDVTVFWNQGLRGGGIWNNGGTLTLRRTDVIANTASAEGGGIYSSGGTVDLEDTSLVDNVGSHGGGLYSAAGFAWLRSSRVGANRATGVGARGGGIYNAGDLQLDNVTAEGNEAIEGGAIWTGAGSTAAILYSTVADNTAENGDAVWSQGTLGFRGALLGGGCTLAGGIVQFAQHSIEGPGATCALPGGMNLSNVADLGLAPVGVYGGPTRTRALFPGSPAIDPVFPAILPDPCPAVDGRGFARANDGDADGVVRCDVGAVEAYPEPLWTEPGWQFRWTAVPGATSYHVYRGFLSNLTDSDADGLADFGYGACVDYLDPDPTDTAFSDPTVVAVSDGFFYLRTAVTPRGETSLGFGSSRGARSTPTPCP